MIVTTGLNISTTSTATTTITMVTTTTTTTTLLLLLLLLLLSSASSPFPSSSWLCRPYRGACHLDARLSEHEGAADRVAPQQRHVERVRELQRRLVQHLGSVS
jgi:hypothetical protein